MICGRCGKDIEGSTTNCSMCGAAMRRTLIRPDDYAVIKSPRRAGGFRILMVFISVCAAILLIFSFAGKAETPVIHTPYAAGDTE
ncbi:MAG: hypothetical protein FWG36_04980 [Oscillospiraceae bacterium]|nr:hypothetical protein [Oscillospiraceae bacterium]